MFNYSAHSHINYEWRQPESISIAHYVSHIAVSKTTNPPTTAAIAVSETTNPFTTAVKDSPGQCKSNAASAVTHACFTFVAVCKKWCASHKLEWEAKCKWSDKCGGCFECKRELLVM